jgi:hypothetical protein
MTACALSLRYTLTSEADGERPRFALEPDAGAAHQVKFSATNLRSVDRLDVKWSSIERMNNDGKNPAAVALGRLGRAANTPAQKAAARANGKRGGRPKGAKDSKPRKRRVG